MTERIDKSTLIEDLQLTLKTSDLKSETVSFINDLLIKIETGYYDKGV